ncbi:dual specificity protein phosphatase family protein [Candidatus Woesearchaeota archaeon]|nr:dual specificity protein phosphatase family protein [Candidatus Woesearchaeota archaeon]
MKHKPLTFEYSQISEYIYIGTNMCCQAHFDKSLLRKGIKADISLEEKRLDHPFGVDYYLWLPTKDHQAPTLKQLRIGVGFLKEALKQKNKCYVHCQRGHGRAPTLVAAFLVSEGINVQKAFSLIKKKRPDIHPNKRQIAMIEKFKKSL